MCMNYFVIQKERGLRREHVRDSEEDTESRKKQREKLLECSTRRIKGSKVPKFL